MIKRDNYNKGDRAKLKSWHRVGGKPRGVVRVKDRDSSGYYLDIGGYARFHRLYKAPPL